MIYKGQWVEFFSNWKMHIVNGCSERKCPCGDLRSFTVDSGSWHGFLEKASYNTLIDNTFSESTSTGTLTCHNFSRIIWISSSEVMKLLTMPPSFAELILRDSIEKWMARNDTFTQPSDTQVSCRETPLGQSHLVNSVPSLFVKE